MKDELRQELAVNGAADPLEAADGLTDEERARLKAEKKAAKKEKKVQENRVTHAHVLCSATHAWARSLLRLLMVLEGNVDLFVST